MISYQTEGVKMPAIKRRETTAWIKAVAATYGKKVGDIAYIFCNDEKILEVNREYLQHDYYTDIITFDYCDLEGRGVVSGDIFIDVDTVADNARIYGATRRDEMLRVVVHGVLHLCGQKDKTPRAEKQMHRKEDKYLKLLEEQFLIQNSKFKIQNQD